MASRARHESGQARQEVKRLEQAAPGILPPAAFVHPWTAELAGAIAEGPLELVHHQPVAVQAQTLECERSTRHVAA
jgi:hypothetical protein